mgnify:CR=1 FL=1
MSKPTKTVTPPPTPTPEQRVERARTQARLGEPCAAEETLPARPKRTADLLGVNVVSASTYGDLILSFGRGNGGSVLSGLVELRVFCVNLSSEQVRAALVPGAEYHPTLTCKPSAYSLGSDATLDSAEAQGHALLEAARFGRTLLALLNNPTE